MPQILVPVVVVGYFDIVSEIHSNKIERYLEIEEVHPSEFAACERHPLNHPASQEPIHVDILPRFCGSVGGWSAYHGAPRKVCEVN